MNEELKKGFDVEKWLDDVYGFDADDAYTSEEVFNLAESLAKDAYEEGRKVERERILEKAEEMLRFDDKTGVEGSGYLLAARDANQALDSFKEAVEKGL